MFAATKAFLTLPTAQLPQYPNTVTATFSMTSSQDYGTPQQLLVNAAGTRLYANVQNYGGQITGVGVANAETDTDLTFVPTEYVGNAKGIVLSPDGAHIYQSNLGNSSLSKIATSNNTYVATLPNGHGAGALYIAVNPISGVMYVQGYQSGTFFSPNLYAVTTLGGANLKTMPSGVCNVAVHPDGSKIYVYCLDKNIYVVNTSAFGLSDTVATIAMKPEADEHNLAVTPDGSKLIATTLLSGEIVSIDTSTNTIGNYTTLGSGFASRMYAPPSPFAFTADSSFVYCAVNNSVAVVDTSSGSLVETIPVPQGSRYLAMNPLGTKLYCASLYGVISVITTA